MNDHPPVAYHTRRDPGVKRDNPKRHTSISGDRRLVLQAATAHPAYRDLDVTGKIVAELFEAQREWMPEALR